MDKIKTGGQTELFPELLKNKPPANPHKKANKTEIITPLEETLAMLKMAYIEEKLLPNASKSKIRRKLIGNEIQTEMAELKKRLLKILGGDQEKFNNYIQQLKKEISEKENKTPNNPYKIRVNNENKKKQEAGPPFCEKCGHYHWPEEPHSDWED